MTAFDSLKRLTPLWLLLITLCAILLRLAYALNSHPFLDEYTTMLAARETLKYGYPRLPSGLFYEHGLLFTYLDALFIGLLGEGEFTARLPSLLVSVLTVGLIYRVAGRWFGTGPALLAALFFALSPEGMVWGGRARMYALAQLLVLGTVYLAYRGAIEPGGRRVRYAALLLLLAALLSHYGVIILVPPLLGAVALVAWRAHLRGGGGHLQPRSLWPLFFEGAVLAAVVLAATVVKRLGQPLGLPAPDLEAGVGALTSLWQAVAYQVGGGWDGASSLQFLARLFGVPHHFWLLFFVLLGLAAAVAGWRAGAFRGGEGSGKWWLPAGYLGIIVVGLVAELALGVEPFRRNPRYMVAFLPLFYLLGGAALAAIVHWWGAVRRRHKRLPAIAPAVVLLPLAMLHTNGLWAGLSIAYHTPEPAYEEAYRYVAARRQPGDVLLTMNPTPAALYLGRSDYFAIQHQAEQFLLEVDGRYVDRWTGSPWLGSAAELEAVLERYPRVWFVVDTIRLPVYYGGDWLARVYSAMERIWAEDEALVYLSRPEPLPLAAAPQTPVSAEFGGRVRLAGYALETQREPRLVWVTLFWQALEGMDDDYTIFVHLRDAQSHTPAQWDGQPLDGMYPTSRWRTGETVAVPLVVEVPAELPAGAYTLAVGLYRLDDLGRLPLAEDTSDENALLIPVVLP